MQTTANLEQALLDHLRQLPPDRQQEVLGFAEFLRQKTASQTPRRSLKGLCTDLNLDITEADIAAARREMWGNFPRELPE